ncbi:hypothetical protein [Marinospirillum alkaliphilum]|uniref:Formate dehydrogenase region TAT target n=1 Tax=Marinospirillum alkaliphilum DSM 21637 TaxID=1122209 RepID=A0A1K1Y196_9GAMM|nr:hypothetical protein [Marinospirillum alkaliphilum]SFX55331.1 formate dehydrogenase region TAT target [Marinospirillum alkaliphilum DSM 21637]
MQNNNTSATVQAERRRFLKGLASASAAAGLAAAAGTAMASSEPVETPVMDDQVQGYRESDHIRAYYASCR